VVGFGDSLVLERLPKQDYSILLSISSGLSVWIGAGEEMRTAIS